jgi:ribosomal protein S18 acetylase RimI-like enzyme
MIRYSETLDEIDSSSLQGFFINWGWPTFPSPQTHLDILQNSYACVIAVDDESGQVVGYITAISDGILSAYIPLLEVLTEWQGQGIGSELVRRMLERLDGLYMIDLLCDPDVQPFYARHGMLPATGMMIRSYARQTGES